MTAKYYRDVARQKLSGNWKTSVIVALIAWFLGGLLVSAAVGGRVTIQGETYTIPAIQEWVLSALKIGTILGIVQFVVGGVVRQGYATFLLKQHDGEKAEIHDLFSQFHRFGDGFCLYLLEVVFVFLWSLLLIIPGIIAGFSYAMAPFIMAENENMTASEALRASKELMMGHKWELFCLDFSFIGWNLLGIVTLGISALFVNPYMNAAYAAFYRVISLTNVRSTPEYLPPAEQQ